jgi:hypothetical protein
MGFILVLHVDRRFSHDLFRVLTVDLTLTQRAACAPLPSMLRCFSFCMCYLCLSRYLKHLVIQDVRVASFVEINDTVGQTLF